MFKSWSLLCKREGLSSDPQNPDEKPGMIFHAYTFNSEGQQGRDRLPSGADSSASGTSGETLHQRITQRALKEDTPLWSPHRKNVLLFFFWRWGFR